MIFNNGINSYINTPSVFMNQVWTGGGNLPATNVSAFSPWSSTDNVDTDIFSSTSYFLAPHVSSSSFTMSLDCGDQDQGVYKLIFGAIQGSSRPIITIIETNTSLSIGTFDTYTPGGSTATDNIEMYFNWNSTGNMTIQFSCPTKNVDSSGYDMAIINLVQLVKIS